MDLNKMVNSFLMRGFLAKEPNQTDNVLKPKKENSATFQDFSPISLCNVAYKVASKTIANRLKQLMPDLITPFQNAFVKYTLIYDNILIVGEILQHLKKKRKQKSFWEVLKIDTHKAFGRNGLPDILAKTHHGMYDHNIF